MTVTRYRVSERGQMALPADARRRWGLSDGGAVDVADLGHALLIVPADREAIREIVRSAIDEVGGYELLAGRVADREPDLA